MGCLLLILRMRRNLSQTQEVQMQEELWNRKGRRSRKERATCMFR